MDLQRHLKCLSAVSLRQQGPGPPTRSWVCRDQKSSGCLGEWQKNEFPRNIPDKALFQEKLEGGRSMTPLFGLSSRKGVGTGVGWGLSSLHLARWWLTRINFNTLSQTTFMATKTVKVVIYIEDLLSKKSHDPLITWYSNSDFFYTIYWFKAV